MTKKRRELVRQKRSSRSRQQMIIIGVILLVGVVAVVGAYLYLNRQVSLPEGAATAYAGIEQGFTDDGFPRLGSATAPILVEDFSSFGCPHCEDLHEDQIKLLLDEAAAGQVQIVFYPVISIGGEYAQDATRAALCAGQQGKFWEMNDIMFYWRSRYSINDFRLDQAAEEIDLDAGELKSCYGDDAMEDVIERSQGEFVSRGLNSTPRVFLNGQEISAGAVVSEVATQIEALGLETGR